MAAQFAIDVSRTDLLKVNPDDIKLPPKDARGRCKPLEKSQIALRAESIFDNGQQQPCVVRKLDDGNLEMVSGFTRLSAVQMIRAGFKGQDGVHRQDKDLLLQVRVDQCDENEAFRKTVIENAHRNQTSPIDDAFNQQVLRERDKLSDADIARLYNWDPATVSRHKGLLQLDKNTQNLVHDGKMSMNAALDTLAMKPEMRSEVVAKAVKPDGKVDSQSIRKAVREHKLTQAQAPKAEPVPPPVSKGAQAAPQEKPTPKIKGKGPSEHKSRTLKEVKDFFQDAASEVPGPLARLCSTVVKYCEGKLSDKQMINGLVKAREDKE